MGKVIMSGIVPQLVAPCPYDPVFANNTWADIIAACQTNNIPDEWEVGDQKAMTINGTSYIIDIIGRNHDDYADGSGKAPLTFQMHGCYSEKDEMKTSNSNAGGWRDSTMRNTHLPAIMALMSSDVQAGLKEVNKLTSAGNQSSSIYTTADKLFLLSEIEIFGSTQYSKSGEGSQYDYYKAGNSPAKTWIYTDGLEYACAYWERSPYGSNTTAFCYVGNTGNREGYHNASNSEGISFAFCF